MEWREYDNESTISLINLCNGAEKSIANAALLCLMFRFRAPLLKRCEVYCKVRNIDTEIVADVVEEAFIKFAKAKKFDAKKCNSSRIDDCLLVYLIAIVKNRIYDKLKEEKAKKTGKYYDGSENIIFDIPNGNSLVGSEKIIRDVLQRYSKAHRAIYLTYKVYEYDGRKLPRALLKKIREEFGITQNTVRTYKKEINDGVSIALSLINKKS